MEPQLYFHKLPQELNKCLANNYLYRSSVNITINHRVHEYDTNQYDSTHICYCEVSISLPFNINSNHRMFFNITRLKMVLDFEDTSWKLYISFGSHDRIEYYHETKTISLIINSDERPQGSEWI